ncbi:hypothetical protein [Calothrix sp. NIES-2098]|uniref:hypothetical protein n=1 Tax=Calothrix sp. NIES-2098 TaxID=1954171 RepID=UPI000B608B9F|nr:hypothetical protein NIES2098_34520 [Calothrix sp. NIES-2098]
MDGDENYLVTLYEGNEQERQFEMSQGELSVHFPVQMAAMEISGMSACEIADNTGAIVIERIESSSK